MNYYLQNGKERKKENKKKEKNYRSHDWTKRREIFVLCRSVSCHNFLKMPIVITSGI